jgi:hypothetical protein
MHTLTFEKISRYDRRAEPVSFSIPFAAGKLTDAAHLTLRDGDAAVPSQTRVLGSWPDGSIKWLQVHVQPDLPGNLEKILTFEASDTPGTPAGTSRLTVTEGEAGIRVDTGNLAFLVPTTGFLPLRDVQLGGNALWRPTPFDGFALRIDGITVSTATSPITLTVEEAGPLKAVILVEGRHRRTDGSSYLDFRGRVTAYAGKSYVEVEHQFIHREEEPELALESLTLRFRPEGGREAPPQWALGQGYYQTQIQESGEAPLAMVIDTETLLYQANEHFIDSFYGDFWADWRDTTGGLGLSLYQAHQNFPKGLRVTAEGIDAQLYPETVAPAPLLRGMAKTHRLLLHFHEPEPAADEARRILDAVSIRSLQFQLPDHPALSREWFRANNPWLEDFFPVRLPDRLITFLNKVHDGRPKAMGMFHFGDAPDAGYTNQGRGQGHSVWVNNEYDRPHACALYYALTGQRRVLDSALVSARHWLDVDLCHYDPDPLIDGGLKIHTRYHVTGGVTPSHEWTEGFLDYYFLTGRTEALDAARSVAENILRHLERPQMRTPGATSVREGGWALRALVGMWIGTGEERWREAARRLITMYLDWFDTFGALLAPYTSHSMPRVPFMISLTVNSFARYLLIEPKGDLAERVKGLIVGTVDDMLAHCMGPDGIAYYKELPSLRHTAPTYHLLEALTYAYRITGDEHYLKVATRQFAAMSQEPGTGSRPKFTDDSGAVIDGEGGGRIFADKYTSLLLYAGTATAAGMLDWYEYPY